MAPLTSGEHAAENGSGPYRRERFAQIPGFPDYWVSILGRVISWKHIRPRVVKPRLSREYLVVDLMAGGKRYTRRVHRLVLAAFVGPCPPEHEAAHLNGQHTDNRLANLKWATRRENAQHRRVHGTQTAGTTHVHAKLTAQQVRELRTRAAGGESLASIARHFSVHGTTALRVVRGERYADV